MFRQTHDCKVEALKLAHQKDSRRVWDFANGQVTKAERRIDGLIGEIAKREYRNTGHFYELRIALDPHTFGLMSGDRESLQHLAKCIAYRVEGEIATGHFVRMARETRYREMSRYMPTLDIDNG